jgi:hypothetical protein
MSCCGSDGPRRAVLAKPCPSETLISYVRSAAERAQTTRARHPAETEPNLVNGTVVPFPKAG